MKTIETLRRLRAAATGGRWEVLRYGRGIDIGPSLDGYVAAGGLWDNAQHQADAAHIAAAHNSQEALLNIAAAAPAFARMAEALGNAPDDWRIIAWDAGRIIVTAGDVRRIAAALAELEALEL